jgi:NADH-quinone oxidoreductase subunit G
MAVNIVVDGQVVPAQAEANLLEALLAAKLDVPYFCWHKALGSVGACRQCGVKVYKTAEGSGQIVMACMTPVVAGMRVSIADAQAASFREAVVEAVLTNHPHDCPVCEVGGECHLQDMTVLTGHTTRQDRFAKRTHLNQDLGPFIKHEMNRCIACYRCLRFYRDYAGGDDFGVFGANRNVYFGRAKDGALENEFAGNLVEVCPTGVFVDKPFSAVFRRKWDMRATPSICPHCAVGCNITVQERAGKFRRVVNRFNETLNGYFLCDRGRFGVGFLESERRLRKPRRRGGGVLTHDETRDALVAVLHEDGVIGIGSPRASVEANFVLRELVGPENFYAGVSDYDAAQLEAAMVVMRATPMATLQDAEAADAILLLGDDPLVVAPRLALSLRQAAQRAPAALLAARGIPAWHDAAARNAATGQRNAVVVVSEAATWLDDVAAVVLREPPQDLAVAVAEWTARTGGDGHAAEIARGLKAAVRPVVVAGGGPALLFAAANIVLALRRQGIAARLAILMPEANSAGLGMMETRPLPVMGDAPVIVLENDLFRRGVDAEAVARARLVVLDHIETPTVNAAELAVAVGSFADCDGTFVNMEGRVQTFYKAIFGAEDPPASWMVLRDAGIAAGRFAEGTWATRSALLEAVGDAVPALAKCKAAPAAERQTPTLPHRFSGRTAMDARFDVREPAPPVHEDSPLGTTMEGAADGALAPLVWAPGWNSGQAVNKMQPPAADVFLYESLPSNPEFFSISARPEPERPAILADELSALAPAMIARRLS